MTDRYVELHARSAFSFLEGASLPEAMVQQAANLQRHRVREQEVRNEAAVSLARELRLPILATNGVNMATAFEREVLDVLTTIRHRTSLDEAGLLLQHNANRHLRSPKEMASLFRDLPRRLQRPRSFPRAYSSR